MSILIDLWHGNISPSEHHIPDTKHTLELREQAVHYSEELHGMFSAEAKQTMQKLQDCTDALDDVRGAGAVRLRLPHRRQGHARGLAEQDE